MKYTCLVFLFISVFNFHSNAQTKYKEKTKKKIEGSYQPSQTTSVQTETAHTAFATSHNTNATAPTSVNRGSRYHRSNYRRHHYVTYRHTRNHRRSHAKKHKMNHYKKIKRVYKKHEYKVKYKS